MQVTFTFERETKNKYRFQEDDQDTPIVGTLYVDKRAFDSRPERLIATIEAE